MKNSFVRPQSGWGWFIILLQVAALSGLADLSARAQNIEPGKEQKALSPNLKPGDYIWEPEVSPAGPVAIIVSLAEHLQGFVTQQPDGSLIGPFNALLHFPAYGSPAWDLFLALAGGSTLPKNVRETVILATGARHGSLYELYSHESLAPKAGLSAAKIRTLAAGERPADLTDEEAIGYLRTDAARAESRTPQ